MGYAAYAFVFIGGSNYISHSELSVGWRKDIFIHPYSKGTQSMQTVSTCLWFDDQAEEAVDFYLSLFPNSRIIDTTYYLERSPRPAGSVLTIQFTLDGTEYLALNGGPHFTFSPAISLVAYCDTQEGVDHPNAKMKSYPTTSTPFRNATWSLISEAAAFGSG